VVQFEPAVGLLRLGNPLRNILIPTNRRDAEMSTMIQAQIQEPSSPRAFAARSRKVRLEITNTSPNIHAAIL